MAHVTCRRDPEHDANPMHYPNWPSCFTLDAAEVDEFRRRWNVMREAGALAPVVLPPSPNTGDAPRWPMWKSIVFTLAWLAALLAIVVGLSSL